MTEAAVTGMSEGADTALPVNGVATIDTEAVAGSRKKRGVPSWKHEEAYRKEPKSEEIAKLWMNENAIVNQKAAYFTAVNVAMMAALKDAKDANFIAWLCWIGMAVCLCAFVSIARTCAYRTWLRHALEMRKDYGRYFNVEFPYPWQRVKSTYMLTCVPLLGIPAWVVIAHLKIATLVPRYWFPCVWDMCWK